MTTIVSAFVYCPKNTNRSLKDYIKYGIKLLKLPQNKIIFIDEKIFEQFEIYQNKQTLIIKTKIDELYLNKYQLNPNVNTNNPTKDTYDYFTIQCNKTEWIREAINKNHFNTDQYIWLDFGLFHVITKIDLNIINKYCKNIRIASIWDLNKKYNYDIDKDICWYFAGGVFGGDKTTLIKFADQVKKLCIEYVEKKKHLMWEVNIWYIIWKNNKDLFDPYYCDHDNSIVSNY